MLLGAAIALVPISLLLLSVNEANPAWGPYWMIRPLIVVPMAGAAGGAFFHLMSPFRFQGAWKKITAVFICFVVFVFCLWIGTVLGLDGTLWD